MAEELFIPKLGQTVEEVKIINWLVKDGEKVEQGQEVLEVETDKAVFNVEAVEDGYIHIGPYQPDDMVPVLTVVALIGEKDAVFKAPQMDESLTISEDSAPSSTPDSARKPETTVAEARGEKLFASPRARKLAREKDVDLQQVSPTGGRGIRIIENDVHDYLLQEVKASPVARRMAAEAHLDLRTIQGTGPRGEISKADIELTLAGSAASKDAAGPVAKQAALALPDMEVSERQSLEGVRGIIAERMGTSARTTARVTLLMDVDASEFVALREKLKAAHEKSWGFAPGYNELIAKTCACALRRFPYMNARLNGAVIERLADVNIGIAVDSERGLYVPVIRNVDQKSLEAVGMEFRQRVAEVRERKIGPENLSGGTFTITNLGMYDVDGFTPIINLPEAAILGVGRIASKAVVVGEQIVIRKMVTLSLAFDHRLTDGAPAAKFLQYIKEMIEQPNEVTLTK